MCLIFAIMHSQETYQCCSPSLSRNSHGQECFPICVKFMVNGKWDVWELLLVKFMEKIPHCPFASALIHDWKEVLSNIKWDPANPHTNYLRGESIFWRAIFDPSLACQEPVRSYNLSKMGVKCIANV